MAEVKFYIELRGDKTKPILKDRSPVLNSRGKPTYEPIEKNVPILLKYSFNGQRFEYFTGYRTDKVNYNKGYYKKSKADPIKSKAPDSEYLNENLKNLKNHVHNLETKAKRDGITLTPEYFKVELDKLVKAKPQDEPYKMTLLKFFDVYIEYCKNGINEKTGHKLSSANAVKYSNMKNVIEDFGKFRSKELDFEEIDKDLSTELINYMINEKKYAINTYGRAIKFIKTVLHAATQQGYNTKLDYKIAFKGVSEPSDSTYLNEKELEAMYALDLRGDFKHERVRDLFIVGCWTGLRFGDFTTIQKDDIRDNRIRIIAKKTKRKVIIPIHPTVKAILEKYNYELPPAISNQKFNVYLSEVAEKAEISEPFTKKITKAGKVETITAPKYEFITSHVARRSFATNCYKNGYKPLLIMAITGHKTETEFLKYIKISDEEKADLFAESASW